MKSDRTQAFSYIFGTLALASLVGTLRCGRSSQEPLPTLVASAPIEQNVSALGSSTLHVDDDLTVTQPNTIVNRYGALAVDAAVGSMQVTVVGEDLFRAKDAANPQDQSNSLVAGDVVMVIQMQGATISKATDRTYGAITIGGAGLHEFIQVASVDAANHQITFDAASGGLKNTYGSAGHSQVIRVPLMSKLVINAGSSITAPAWGDSHTGGIVTIRAFDVTLNGKIDVTGKGFRGGPMSTGVMVPDATPVDTYVSNDPTTGARKGESIAGYTEECMARLDCYGRGAVANGGGGGNGARAGGGGGANGRGSAVQDWNGNGIMDSGPNNIWVLSWSKEIGILTNEVGGGRGGYTYSSPVSVGAANPTVDPPGDMAWGGNFRLERGGLGGRPLESHAFKEPAFMDAPRIFLGGGGGAGNATNIAATTQAGVSGGAGGGMIYLLTSNIRLTGQLIANGAKGGDAFNTMAGNFQTGGGGGGGAGGTIVLDALEIHGNPPGIDILANGGVGGDQAYGSMTMVDNVSGSGPGGGGGGGALFIGASPTRVVTLTVFGGNSGHQSSAVRFVQLFRPNGATNGSVGSVDPYTLDPGVITHQLVVDPASNAQAGGTLVYKLTLTNPDIVHFHQVTVTGSSPIFAGMTWTCSGNDLATCSVASGTGNPTNVLVNLGPGSNTVFTVSIPLPKEQTCQNIIFTTDTTDIANQVFTDTATATIHAPVKVSVSANPPNADGLVPEDYKITVTNTHDGCTPVNDLTVRFTMPPGSRFQSADGGSTWDCGQTGDVVSCKQVGTDALSDIRVTLYPPPQQQQMEVKAEVFVGTATAPADKQTLVIPITNVVIGAASGGGFSCALTGPEENPPGLLGMMFLVALLAVGFYARQRTSCVKNQSSARQGWVHSKAGGGSKNPERTVCT